MREIHQIDEQGLIYEQGDHQQALHSYFTPNETPLAFSQRWKQEYLYWVLLDDVSFSQAASPRLRTLFTSAAPKLEALLPKSSNSVRNWITAAYEEKQQLLKDSLHAARSKIHLSFDVWSSPNDHSFTGVTGHWIDKDYQLKTALLGLPALTGQGRHTGSTIANTILTVVDRYSLQNKVGCFQLDNASNNKTAIEAIAAQLPTVDPQEQQLRCLGHVLNLVVRAILFGNGLSATQKELAGANDKEEFEIWRRHGSIGKLHNLVKYINRTEQRQSAFKKAQAIAAAVSDDFTFNCKLIADGGVRWNSTYLMIERALKVESALDYYCKHWQQPPSDSEYDLSQDFLTIDDWRELRRFAELLKPFEKTTLRLEGVANKAGKEGSYGAVWEVIPAFDYCFEKLKTAALSCSKEADSYYRSGVDSGFLKLREYYTLSDKSRIYRAAVALHPAYRFNYFDTQWTNPTWISAAKRATRELFDEYLEAAATAVSTSVSTQRQRQPQQDPYDSDDDYERFFRPPQTLPTDSHTHRAKRQRQASELDAFMDAEKILIEGYAERPLAWWRDIGRQRYPLVAQMAFDLFSIPAMSSECERVFSHSKLMITDHGHRLKEDVIEATQCLSNWIRQGFIPLGDPLLTQIPPEPPESIEIDL